MKDWKPIPPPFRKFKAKQFKKVATISQFIYQIGDYDELRKPSKEVSVKDIKTKDFQAKIKYLKDSMRKYRRVTGFQGRGITAVQLGIPERFSVVYTPKKLLIIINPKITKISKAKYLFPEICMSAAPIISPTVRPAWIEFEYHDENGRKNYWKTKDKIRQERILNRVFQHEFDHMDGIINIDKLTGKELIFEVDPKFYDRAKFEKVK